MCEVGGDRKPFKVCQSTGDYKYSAAKAGTDVEMGGEGAFRSHFDRGCPVPWKGDHKDYIDTS